MKELENYLEELNYFYKGKNWLEAKKILLKIIPSELRSKFSTRNDFTKKQELNNFEKQIISYYKDRFNIELILEERNKHVKNEDPIWKNKSLD